MYIINCFHIQVFVFIGYVAIVKDLSEANFPQSEEICIPSITIAILSLSQYYREPLFYHKDSAISAMLVYLMFVYLKNYSSIFSSYETSGENFDSKTKE